MRIFKSRFTPGIKASETKFQRGDKIIFVGESGIKYPSVIDSDIMSHMQCPTFGYECIDSANGERFFADVARIIWWEGKMETMRQLRLAMDAAELQK